MWSSSGDVNVVVVENIQISVVDGRRIVQDWPEKKTLTSVVQVLKELNSWLSSSFMRQLAEHGLPLLVVSNPATLMELKSNIDKYLQYGFMKDPARKHQFYAAQLISDYCVGLSLGPEQTREFFKTHDADANPTANAVLRFCKNHDVSRTPVQKLLDLCSAYTGNVKDPFA